jgi:hypothetical protein
MASPLQQKILTTLQEQCQRLDYDMFVVLQPSTNSKSKLWTATGSLKNLFGSLISEIANYVDVDGSDSTECVKNGPYFKRVSGIHQAHLYSITCG